MNADLGALSLAALTIGFLHTLCGPDHYLPFVAMSRAGGWSLKKTSLVTLLCGVGHVASSVVLGFIGIAFGVILFRLEEIESRRGELAGWLLIAFGLAYFAAGVMRAIRNRPHSHLHVHPDGTVHAHDHVHQGEHLHAHAGARSKSLTPWVLFTIFLFGPCEPLIPFVMYPASEGNAWGVVQVTVLFALATLATMTGMVLLLCSGTQWLRLPRVERYSHALAGLVVLGCGIAIKFGM